MVEIRAISPAPSYRLRSAFFNSSWMKSRDRSAPTAPRNLPSTIMGALNDDIITILPPIS
ncbi:hypothetical protein D3C84_1304660 [compost metagenome]